MRWWIPMRQIAPHRDRNAGPENLAHMAGSKSPHILSTSSNLLGFCLIVMTSLKISDHTEAGILDELTGIAAVLLMASCILSFQSMRSKKPLRSERLERTADVIFLGGLSLVFLAILLITFHFLV